MRGSAEEEKKKKDGARDKQQALKMGARV